MNTEAETTTSPRVIESNKKHILSFYDSEDAYFKEVYNRLLETLDPIHRIIEELVFNGRFLTSMDDIRNYVVSILGDEWKERDDGTVSMEYVLLLARDGESLWKEIAGRQAR